MEKAPGMYRLILDDEPLRTVAQNARLNLDIVPGDKRTEKAQRYLASVDFREHVLQNILDHTHYDVILIDLAPSLGVLHVAALVASDWVVIPTRLDALAVDGVNEVLHTYAEIVRQGGRPQGYSVLPTFFDRTTNETREQLRALIQAFGVNVLQPIPNDTKAREAAAFGQTIWEYAPHSAALAGYPNGHGNVGGYLNVTTCLVDLWGL
jgi:chromosome partitioning protein